MTGTKISQRALEIERQFRAMKQAPEFDLEQERQNTKDAHVLTGVPKDVLMEWETVAGIDCIRMRPSNSNQNREMIFIHGGAYCLMSAMTHHRFGGHIANAIGADVIIPDYSLAPESVFPAARDECLKVVDERRTSGPETQILAGDSAGGGLALSVSCQLRNQKKNLPDAMIMMSPWLDLSLSGDQLQTGAIDDPILSLRNLKALADLYRGEADLTDPAVSPIFANLDSLPPTLVQIAEKDLLREDGERLADFWPSEGVLQSKYYPGMLHSFQMFAGDMPEADQAIVEISLFLEQHLS